MQRSTATKVLAGLAAFVLLGTLASGDLRLFGRVLVACLIVGFFFWAGWLRGRPRQRALEDEARRLGLRYAERDPFGTLDEPFALLRRTALSYGAVDNVLWGAWHGLELRAFDYAYSETEKHVRRFSCAAAAIPGGWPSLDIRPETLRTAVADRLAMPDVRFESDAFNRAFEVRCEEPRFASAVIDARMIEWLLGMAPTPGFEVQGRWILAYRSQVQPWELEELLGLLEAFVERIPGAARSLYPEALPPRPDGV